MTHENNNPAPSIECIPYPADNLIDDINANQFKVSYRTQSEILRLPTISKKLTVKLRFVTLSELGLSEETMLPTVLAAALKKGYTLVPQTAALYWCKQYGSHMKTPQKLVFMSSPFNDTDGYPSLLYAQSFEEEGKILGIHSAHTKIPWYNIDTFVFARP